ncbi:hypothetical protein [Modestobacter sp. URMC 112]
MPPHAEEHLLEHVLDQVLVGQHPAGQRGGRAAVAVVQLLTGTGTEAAAASRDDDGSAGLLGLGMG